MFCCIILCFVLYHYVKITLLLLHSLFTKSIKLICIFRIENKGEKLTILPTFILCMIIVLCLLLSNTSNRGPFM